MIWFILLCLWPLWYFLYLVVRVIFSHFYYRERVIRIRKILNKSCYETNKNFNSEPIDILFEKRNYPLKNRKIRKVI